MIDNEEKKNGMKFLKVPYNNIAENEDIDCNDISVWDDNGNDSLYPLDEDGNKTYKTPALQILYELNSKNT